LKPVRRRLKSKYGKLISSEVNGWDWKVLSKSQQMYEMVSMLSPQAICRKILDVHEGIRWVKIIDQEGKIAFEEKKSHVEPYLSEEAMKNLREFWIAAIQGVVGKIAQYWGPPQHLHIQFSKILVFGFPYISGAVVITAEPNVPLTTVSKIQEILKKSYAVEQA